MTLIERKFAGVIPPLRLGSNSNNRIIPLIDWSAIWNKHIPIGAILPEWQVQLEYLQCNYLIRSVARVPSSEYPHFSAVDSGLKKQSKVEDYRYKFNVKTGYAVAINLHSQWNQDAWGESNAMELLYNLGGNIGYLNLFSPYLTRDANVVFGDRLIRLGVSVEGDLKANDFIEINGGYSGTFTYSGINYDLQAAANKMQVGVETVKLLSARESRARVYVGNAGTTPLYFRFTENAEALDTGAAPFIPPGEALTLENGKVFCSEHSQHWMQDLASYYVKLSLYVVRLTGSGLAVVEEHYV